MALNLIVLGPPGAGKGTQAEQFAREHQVPKISTGDILREAVQSGTTLGSRVKAVMEAGRLVSDDIMIDLVRERLARSDVVRGFVLDGFPRTVAQARALDAIMAGRAPLIVLDITVPESELVRRLQARRICGRCGAPAQDDERTGQVCARCGGPLVQRADDDEGVVRERLAVYGRETKPLVEYYQARPTFRAIDGNQRPEWVAAEIQRQVESLRVSDSRPAAASASEERA